MNPFMFQMMNPMGMGFMPFGCCCGVNMPYYGMDDRLTFMNFPVFRNTSMDYLLDPRLAMMQAQQQWQYGGGSIFGNTYLPLFNNFPGIGGGFSPFVTPGQRTTTETEEEKKKREAKEAEGKKPEAEKAALLKKSFDNIKKLAEANKNFVNLDSNIVKKAEDAMKKETAAEQLAAMKEVMAAIPDDIIKKSILADDEVKKQLIEAGYNFNYANNKYSLPVTSIIDDLNDVHDSIVAKLSATSNNTGLPLLVANIAGGKTPVLAAISAWNNTQNEKGIINFISNNIPTDEAAKSAMKECVKELVNALLKKADEYNGCDKIKKERDNLATQKNTALAKFDAASLKNLSTAFEKLYARLRMQEAVKVRDYITSKNEFKVLNEAKPNLITNGMIVDETYECLKKEGIITVPKENELDKIASATVVTVGSEGVIDADKKYEGKPQELIDEYLVGEKHALTKVGETNVYATSDFDGKGSGVKYYTVKDGKVVEATKKSDGTFEAKESAVSASDIEKYDESVKTIKSMLESKSIERCKDFASTKLPYPVFKSATKNEYFTLIGNTFGKIKNCTALSEDLTNKKIHATGTKKTLDKLTEADLEEFDVSSVKSKEQEAKEKKEAEEKKQQEEIQNVTSATFASLKEAKSNKKLDEISKAVTGKDGQHDLKPLKVNGYFYSNSTKRYYRYNENTNQLEYLPDVVEINKNGYMKLKNGRYKECREVISDTPIKDEELVSTIQEYGKTFAKDVNGKSTEEEDSDAFRKLNTIIVKNDPIYTINFIKGYQEYGGLWSNKGICEQIAKENGFAEGTSAHVFNTKRRYIKEFAKLILKVIDITNFDRESDDYATLQKIANGEYITKKYRGGDLSLGGFGGSKRTDIVSTAQTLDSIIEKVMKIYDEENTTTT